MCIYGIHQCEKYLELGFLLCFSDETLQILLQIENQLLVPTPTQPSNMQVAKRAIPEMVNLQDVVQILENITRRVLS